MEKVTPTSFANPLSSLSEMTQEKVSLRDVQTGATPSQSMGDLQRLIEQLFHWAAIVESSDDAVLGKKLDGTITSWNKGAERIYGYTAEEVIGKSVFTIFPQDNIEEFFFIMDKVRRGEKVDHFETKRVRKDGTMLDISVTVSPIRDLSGTIIGASAIGRNITERNNAEQTKKMLAAIVESADDAILSKTLDGTITSWNRGAERLYGYTPEEIIGQPVSVLMPSEKKDDFPYVMGRLRAGLRVEHYETRRITKDGKILDVSVTVSPLKDAAGKVVGASDITRDITEQKRLEKIKDDFIDAASHELKTPLTSQKVFIQMLQKEVEKHGDRHYERLLDRIEKQHKKMMNLISEMLTLTRIQSGKFVLAKTRCDLTGCVQEVVREMQEVARHHQILVKGELSRETEIDQERMSDVISNLLTNAIKYSPDAEKVIITLSEDAENAIITIQDFGIGIAPENHTKVFDRFFRVSGEDESTFPGLGMGLYIASEIVKQHKGRMWVESEKGQGAIFYVSLPFPTESAQSPKDMGIGEV
ncbi:MAG TPA: PAS domain S-box protein [Ktedonobacteraceae bacterium]|nr:PAS domain S-box protein [Ktedonobacteraceae bacterium]